MEKPRPIAFLSYTHEGSEAQAWVRGLAHRLRADGVEVLVDQDLRPGEDIPHWTERAITRAHVFVMICTPEYKRRADLGGNWAQQEISLARARAANPPDGRKALVLLPVLPLGPSNLPDAVRSLRGLELPSPDGPGYEELLRRIQEVAPPVEREVSLTLLEVEFGAVTAFLVGSPNRATELGYIERLLHQLLRSKEFTSQQRTYGEDRFEALVGRVREGQILLLLSSEEILVTPALSDAFARLAALAESGGIQSQLIHVDALPEEPWATTEEVWPRSGRPICRASDPSREWEALALELVRNLRSLYDRLLPTPDPLTQRLQMEVEVLKERRENARRRGEDLQDLDQRILQRQRELRAGMAPSPDLHLHRGRFRIEERLGSGGVAEVWRAFDTENRRDVAVKILHGFWARDETQRNRFFRGAERMMRLSREPSIVDIIVPRGYESGFYYFVMEWLPQGDLESAVLERRLDTKEVPGILARVAHSLATLHDRAMVHRDVKPSNILLDLGFRPKLADFDLIHAVDTFAATQGALGTVVYSAPEAREDASTPGPEADLFSLAMLTLFCLRGSTLPFEVVNHEQSWLQETLPPGPLHDLLSAALERDPSQRKLSAREFARRIEEVWDPSLMLWQAGQGIDAPTEKPAPPVQEDHILEPAVAFDRTAQWLETLDARHRALACRLILGLSMARTRGLTLGLEEARVIGFASASEQPSVRHLLEEMVDLDLVVRYSGPSFELSNDGVRSAVHRLVTSRLAPEEREHLRIAFDMALDGKGLPEHQALLEVSRVWEEDPFRRTALHWALLVLGIVVLRALMVPLGWDHYLLDYRPLDAERSELERLLRLLPRLLPIVASVLTMTTIALQGPLRYVEGLQPRAERGPSRRPFWGLVLSACVGFFHSLLSLLLHGLCIFLLSRAAWTLGNRYSKHHSVGTRTLRELSISSSLLAFLFTLVGVGQMLAYELATRGTNFEEVARVDAGILGTEILFGGFTAVIMLQMYLRDYRWNSKKDWRGLRWIGEALTHSTATVRSAGN